MWNGILGEVDELEDTSQRKNQDMEWNFGGDRGMRRYLSERKLGCGN